MSIDVSIQAMQAIDVSQRVAANNIANMNTDGFRASSVRLEDGPEGVGVRVSSIGENSDHGPMIPSTRLEMNDSGQVEALSQFVEGSNTDVGREMVNMLVNQNAYAANAAVVRAWDQTTGVLLDAIA